MQSNLSCKQENVVFSERNLSHFNIGIDMSMRIFNGRLKSKKMGKDVEKKNIIFSESYVIGDKF